LRSLTDIHNELIAAKEAEPKLAALNSPSRFAIWRLWLYVVATAIWTVEQLFVRHQSEVQALIDQNIFGSAEWFVQKVKAFQYGDDLVRNLETGGLTYETINPTKQIITHAAITVARGDIQVATIKVAKTLNGEPNQLSPNELTAVRGYIDRLQPPGATIVVNSLPADIVRLSLDVYYNPLFDVQTLQTEVENVVQRYFDNLPFDAQILRSKIGDTILAGVSGVNDVVISLFEARAVGGAFAPVERVYIPESGYIKFDPDQPLGINLKTA